MLSSTQGFGLTEEELDLLSEIVDDDQSGAISYREFGRIFNKGKQLVVDVDVAAATVVQVLGDQLHTEEQRVIVAFQAADDDGNGMLTLDEFKSLISSVRPACAMCTLRCALTCRCRSTAGRPGPFH